MNFIKEKIQKYHEKKLKDAQNKLKFHIDVKIKLRKQLNNTNEYKLRINIKEKIIEQNKLIEIWTKNTNSIKSQLEKLEE